jgi:hypothetical protein
VKIQGSDDAIAAINSACAALEKRWTRRQFEEFSGNLFDFILSLEGPTTAQVDEAFSRVPEPTISLGSKI